MANYRHDGGSFSKIKSAAVRLAQKLGQKYVRPGEKLDKEQAQKIDDNIEKMNRGPLAKIWDKVTVLYDLFKSPETPFSKKAVVFGALLYLVMPADVLPDFLMPAGLLDDVAVIAFVYSQCRDLLESTVPRIARQVKAAVSDITDDAAVKLAQKQFRQFSARTAINSFLRLAVFVSSLALLRFSPQSLNAGTVTAAVLLAASSAWLVFAAARNILEGARVAVKFIPEFKRLSAEDRELAEKSGSKKPKLDMMLERSAQALYNSLATPELRQNRPWLEKAASFLFRSWNEGRLPPWIPGKKELAAHVWNAIKIQVGIFLLALTGYVLAYNVFVTHLLAEDTAYLPLWFWVVSPFRYIWQLAVS